MITISSKRKHGFRSFQTLYLMVTLAAMAGCSDGQADSELKASPEKVFQLSTGERQQFSDIDSPYVLMNYWASWCKPCVKEIPELNALDQNPNTAVYAFNFDRLEGEELTAEAAKFDLQLPMMLNEPAPMFNEDSPRGLPATLVVNTATGEQQWLMGAQTKDKILTALNLQ